MKKRQWKSSGTQTVQFSVLPWPAPAPPRIALDVDKLADGNITLSQLSVVLSAMGYGLVVSTVKEQEAAK